MSARMPVVAIVGRPNVGKSSLLNALARRRISIVQDQPGVTRDRISTPLRIDSTHGRRWVELVDTGGFGFSETGDAESLTGHIEDQIEHAVARADLVLFVVDAQAGATALDETIADLLRRAGVEVALVANKTDNEKQALGLAELARLGFGTPAGVSATTGRGTGDAITSLIDDRLDLADAPSELPDPDLLIAVVGKRNAGKSTFVNAVARVFNEEDDRVIVSEVAGTTRDSVDVRFEKDGRTITIIDTAGVRKKRHMVNNDLEFFSFHRAERSIRRADVCLLLLDATADVSEPDKKLALTLQRSMKPVVIVVNKWDLAKATLRAGAAGQGDAITRIDDRVLMQQYREYLRKELPGLAFAPVMFTTASDGKNVGPVLDLCRRLWKQASERVTTGRLNAAVREAVGDRPPIGPGGRRARTYYATQVATNPPVIVLFVNDPKNFRQSYRRFLMNRLRESLPFGEVPIDLQLRGKAERDIEHADADPESHRKTPTR